jgi:hypothetical protein
MAHFGKVTRFSTAVSGERQDAIDSPTASLETQNPRSIRVEPSGTVLGCSPVRPGSSTRSPTIRARRPDIRLLLRKSVLKLRRVVAFERTCRRLHAFRAKGQAVCISSAEPYCIALSLISVKYKLDNCVPFQATVLYDYNPIKNTPLKLTISSMSTNILQTPTDCRLSSRSFTVLLFLKFDPTASLFRKTPQHSRLRPTRSAATGTAMGFPVPIC